MSPQLPDPVRSTLQALVRGLLAILDDRLIGLYLHGSLAMGDFCDTSSDIDFLVVTRGTLSAEDALAVELLHRDLLRADPYAYRLEGDYAPLDLIVPEGTAEPVPGCERGVFLPKVGEIMLSADNICALRKYGIAIYGPDPHAVLPEVTRDQVRAAAREILSEGPGLCETPCEFATAVLNLVRSLASLETGEPMTKSAGAAWALNRLPLEWHPAIRAAQAIRCGGGTLEDTELLHRALPKLSRMMLALPA